MAFLRRLFLGLGLFLLASIALAQSEVGSLSQYQLGPGDVISIDVFEENDLKLEKIHLTDAGTIFFPVLGEIRVLGLTVGALEKVITDGLRGRYLVNPRVSVNVDEYRPFFINGQVERDGAYPFQPGLTIRKAVAIAGGFTERASHDKAFIRRDRGQENMKPLKVDLDTPVLPGDVITVEESFF
jgi:polysaccharide biosynthesis/export protein VpsN